MAELTKRDVQQIVDNARKQILDRVLDRQEIVRINEDVRNRLMNYTQDVLQVQRQQLQRRYDNQNNELARRISQLDARMSGLEQALQTATQLLSKIAQQQQETIAHMLPQDEVEYDETEYSYQRR